MIANEATLHDTANQMSGRTINLIAIYSSDVIVNRTYVWTQRQIITKSINSLSSRIIDFVFPFVMWGHGILWPPLWPPALRPSKKSLFSLSLPNSTSNRFLIAFFAADEGLAPWQRFNHLAKPIAVIYFCPNLACPLGHGWVHFCIVGSTAPPLHWLTSQVNIFSNFIWKRWSSMSFWILIYMKIVTFIISQNVAQLQTLLFIQVLLSSC
jgi:hypothetical protein